MRLLLVAGLVPALVLSACNRESSNKNEKGNASEERDSGSGGEDEGKEGGSRNGGGGEREDGRREENRDGGEERRGQENGGGGEERRERTGGAEEQSEVNILNRTGRTVYTLNISPASDPNWGPDLLGSNVLPTGQTARINYNRSLGCTWDIRVTYSDGGDNDWRNINLCENPRINLDP